MVKAEIKSKQCLHVYNVFLDNIEVCEEQKKWCSKSVSVILSMFVRNGFPC